MKGSRHLARKPRESECTTVEPLHKRLPLRPRQDSAPKRGLHPEHWVIAALLLGSFVVAAAAVL